MHFEQLENCTEILKNQSHDSKVTFNHIEKTATSTETLSLFFFFEIEIFIHDTFYVASGFDINLDKIYTFYCDCSIAVAHVVLIE